MQGCASIDSKDGGLFTTIPSAEIVIGARPEDVRTNYFGRCEEQARDIRVELANLSKNICSIEEEKPIESKTATKELITKLKSTGRLRKEQSRLERIKQYVKGQNHRRVTPGVIENHKDVIT